MGKKSKCAQRRKAGRTLSNLSNPGDDSSPASCAQEEPANGVDGHAPALPIPTAGFEEYIYVYWTERVAKNDNMLFVTVRCNIFGRLFCLETSMYILYNSAIVHKYLWPVLRRTTGIPNYIGYVRYLFYLEIWNAMDRYRWDSSVRWFFVLIPPI